MHTLPLNRKIFHSSNIPSEKQDFLDSHRDLEFSLEDLGYCNNSQNDHACGECVDSKSLDLGSQI
jgi:hypothetical protein